MTTKTLYIDSRTRIKGTHADFTISLPKQMTLRGARVRVDNIRTTDTFPTVTDTNRFVYLLSPTGLTVVSLQLGAYTGTTFAAELAAKTGRNCTYLPSNHSLYLGYDDATRKGSEAGVMAGPTGMLAGAAIGAAGSAALAFLAFRNREATETQDHFLDAERSKCERQSYRPAIRNINKPETTKPRCLETETA